MNSKQRARRTPETTVGTIQLDEKVQIPLHRLHGGLLWTLSICLALVMNLSLFGLMPHLIGRVTQRVENSSPAWPVNIIHLRPAKPPLARIKKPPPEMRKTAPTAGTQSLHAKFRAQEIKPSPLSVDFRPDLPSLPDSLPILALQKVQVPPVAVSAPVATATKAFYNMNEIDAPLMPISRVPPVYPLVARRKGIEGWVKVKFLVTRQGTVERVSIVAAHPANLFEKSVLRAVSSWRFKPGTVSGKPVDTWAESTLEFKLE